MKFPVSALLFLVLLDASAQSRNATYYFEKGEQALARKEYVTAQAHLTECLRLDPHFAEAYRVRAIVREHLGDKARALTDYNIYVDLKPLDAEALFSRGVLRFEANQLLPARQDFLKLLTLPRGETNTVYFSQEKYGEGDAKVFTAQSKSRDHVFNYLGLIETKIPRYDIAIGWLDSAIRLDPKNASYWVNRGVAKQGRRDTEGAAADYARAIELDPNNALALHNLASIKSGEGDNDTSEKLLTEAIEKNKNLPYPRAQRAYHRLSKGNLKGALEDYDEVVRIEPLNADNYVNRGLVREKLNDLHGAEADFAKAIELDDKNEKGWLEHGNIMSKQKKWKEALEDYNVAIHLLPSYGLAYYNRAVVHQNMAQLKQACDDVHKASSLGVKVDVKLRERVCK